MQSVMVDFQITGCMMRFSRFVPRLFNLCKSYGFEAGRIMPSRAFCSDENQGFPIILIAKHFGAFPFDHGMVGGIVATDRHGPHAHHGKDLVIIQASHVGYDPQTGAFGDYRRLQMEPPARTACCGKIGAVLHWYQTEYDFARQNVAFDRMDGERAVIIDNQFLNPDRTEGLFLDLPGLVQTEGLTAPEPLHVLSTSKAFRINPSFADKLPDSIWRTPGKTPIADYLTADLFGFKHAISEALEGRDQLERNLGPYMPQIVSAGSPALTSAMANTQVEFDRTYRTLLKEPGYKGKNLLFIAGINIDISPQPGQIFPLTKFVPWAAYIQTRGGERITLEQKEIMEALSSQSIDNPDRIELSAAIKVMEDTPQVKIIPPAD